MLKKLGTRKSSKEQLDFSEKAAVTAGMNPVGDVKPRCVIDICNVGCERPEELFADNYNEIGPDKVS